MPSLAKSLSNDGVNYAMNIIPQGIKNWQLMLDDEIIDIQGQLAQMQSNQQGQLAISNPTSKKLCNRLVFKNHALSFLYTTYAD